MSHYETEHSVFLTYSILQMSVFRLYSTSSCYKIFLFFKKTTQLNFIVNRFKAQTRTKKNKKEKITKNTKTHTNMHRVSHTYKSLRHFSNIGERQKRSQLTKAWVISLLHEHSERSSENCTVCIVLISTCNITMGVFFYPY